MTIPQLATMIAHEIDSIVEQHNLDSVTALIKVNFWSSEDIKNLICDLVDDLGDPYQFWTDEDGAIYHEMDMLCSYRDFKKLVLSKLMY